MLVKETTHSVFATDEVFVCVIVTSFPERAQVTPESEPPAVTAQPLLFTIIGYM